MLDAIRRFFDTEMDRPAEADADALALAVGALLLEVAESDDEFAAVERATVTDVLRERFSLDADRAARLLELADAARRESSDVFQFTRLISETYDKPRKLAVVEALWRVVWSDGVLEAHEDALMHRLGTLLGLSHRELMALKVRARDQA
ncbi:MAG TPA: TerB family tellurite resistance protein [Candidatus Krumholzibacteria bacterium]|nr:TerB family tellurite resistance protein [Candidatus Krumholzibacteria bacterium]